MSINETAHIVGRYDVPAWVMQKVNDFLPEKKIINSKYLVDGLEHNVPLEEDSKVEVIFVHEGAKYKNTLGYFTYDFDSQGKIQIVSRGLIFPNASYDPKAAKSVYDPKSPAYDAGLRKGGGKLFPGDYTYLMDAEGRKIIFSAGTKIGFFLVPDGWNGVTVDKWDENNSNLPFDNLEKNNSIRPLGVVTSLDPLDPENVRVGGKGEKYSHHFVAFGVKNDSKDFLNGENFLLFCMEDTVRIKEDQNKPGGFRPEGDQDFNDCVFIVRAKGIDICKYPESGCEEADCTYRSIPEITDGLICYDDTSPFKVLQDIVKQA